MNGSLDLIDLPEIERGEYEHYKGAHYEVIGVAVHSETLEPLVVYKPLYEAKVGLWVRPYSMFMGTVVINNQAVPRFRKV